MKFQDKPLAQQVKEAIKTAKADSAVNFDGANIWPLIDYITELEDRLNRVHGLLATCVDLVDVD